MALPREILRCPLTGQRLVDLDSVLVAGERSYPVVDGVPVLLNDETSLFSTRDVAEQVFVAPEPSGMRRWIRRLLPQPTLTIGSHERFERFAQRVGDGRVLIIGGGTLGEGAESLVQSGLEVTETDVYLSPRVDVVCDGHHLPFADGSFDGVVLQAVLEHVLDPSRVVAEVYRVLKPHGLVYAESPFLQGVHEGAFDFTRWTELGHRRLFRMFEELERGVVAGPATTLVWAIAYFARSLPARTSLLPLILEKVSLVAFSWVKYFDYFLISHPGATDAASGTYFMGARAIAPADDTEIIASYAGAIGRPYRRSG